MDTKRLLSVIIVHIFLVLCNATPMFKISLSELRNSVEKKSLEKLKNVLKYEGAFAVSELPPQYVTAFRKFKDQAPACLTDYRFPEFTMPDGSIRTTFATSSGESENYPSCIRDSCLVLSDQFDRVYSTVTGLLEAVASVESLQWHSSPADTKRRNVTDLENKEHIHVYTPPDGQQLRAADSYVAPFHTDNGVLLLITPAPELPLQVRSRGGQVRTSDAGEDSILVLLASALPDWLLQDSRLAGSFYPAPHAVPSLPSSLHTRTVFARMMVAPMDAVPVSRPSGRTFSEIFFRDRAEGDQVEPEVSPPSSSHHMAHQPKTEALKSEDHRWTHLKKSECQEANTSYCWMSCYSLPTCDSPNFKCTNNEDKQCCTDKSQEGTGTCADMDPSCEWKCDAPAPSNNTDSKFCTGGTDMYMKGFQTTAVWSKNTCIILFFPSWVLDTRLKFAFGCLGSIFLGIITEAIICFRRLVQSRKILRIMSSPVRRASIIVLFGVNIALGYLAMLVAMTYSVELFLCMVLGLAIGHAIFNSSSPVGETVDPCCASQVTTNDASSSSSKMSGDSYVTERECCHTRQDSS